MCSRTADPNDAVIEQGMTDMLTEPALGLNLESSEIRLKTLRTQSQLIIETYYL